jgi:transposase InsO family protein
MDFKGHFALTNGIRCHPLTVLDDHSRFALGVVACADERTDPVRDARRGLFEHYGRPARMLIDNGLPWGDEGGQPHTRLTVWLLKLGIGGSTAARITRKRRARTSGSTARSTRSC